MDRYGARGRLGAPSRLGLRASVLALATVALLALGAPAASAVDFSRDALAESLAEFSRRRRRFGAR